LARAWPALDIHVPGCDPQLQELVLAELDDFQPSAIQEQDESRNLRAFFASAEARAAAARALGAAFGHHVFVESIDVEDQDWAARSQAGLRAVTVGRLVIAPPWDVPEKGDGNLPLPFLEVVIRPSMGFGTGHHESTRLMLKALQSLDVRDRAILDIGCGSGVLAIAGARLGARAALGIDVDPDALESAADNIDLNGVGDRVRVQQRDFRDLRSPCPIVLANLTGALLERSAPALAALVEPGGHLVVSGFTETDTAVVPALEKLLPLQATDREGEWQCAVFHKS
jgi:ribosomal protein L11 methyltransferase